MPHSITLRDVEERLSEVSDAASVSGLAVIGAPGEWRSMPTRFPAVVGDDCTIRELVRVHAGCVRETRIGRGTLLMAGSHIGHDVHMGEGCEVAPNAVVGGCCTIGDGVKIGMNASVNPDVKIGDGARIGSGSVVNRDVPAGETWVGVPAKRIARRA